MTYKLNKDTGFAAILDGEWMQSDKCIPLLIYAPIPLDDGNVPTGNIPYVFRPYKHQLAWTGNPFGVILLEKGALSILIEKRFLHSPDEDDLTTPSGTQFAGVFGSNPEGCWRKRQPQHQKQNREQPNYTDLQPIEGETVLLCGHLSADVLHKPQHFWKVEGTEFTRPDGSTDAAAWLALCGMCHQNLQQDPDWQPPITCDAKWRGNAPAIRKVDP